jgi:hypothetical protein
MRILILFENTQIPEYDNSSSILFGRGRYKCTTKECSGK